MAERSPSLKTGLLYDYELGEGSPEPRAPERRISMTAAMARTRSTRPDRDANSLYTSPFYDPEIGDSSVNHSQLLLRMNTPQQRAASPAIIPEGEPSPRRRRRTSQDPQERFFRFCLKFLLLGNQNWRWRALAFLADIFLLLLVPLADYLFVACADEKDHAHKRLFRSLVLLLEVSVASVSLFFMMRNINKHGLRGLLLLDMVKQEPLAVQMAYTDCLQGSAGLLLRLLLPAFCLHLVQKVWWWSVVHRRRFPISFGDNMVADYLFAAIASYSWVYRTVVFLFVCTLFWSICSLQVVKMRYYSQQLEAGADPSWSFHEYVHLCQGLVVLSHRFRGWLASMGVLVLFGMLASMYSVVQQRKDALTFLNSGDLLLCLWVYVNGAWLSLSAASKIAHFHRRIVKLASTMHAEVTCDFGLRFPGNPSSLPRSQPMSPPPIRQTTYLDVGQIFASINDTVTEVPPDDPLPAICHPQPVGAVVVGPALGNLPQKGVGAPHGMGNTPGIGAPVGPQHGIGTLHDVGPLHNAGVGHPHGVDPRQGSCALPEVGTAADAGTASGAGSLHGLPVGSGALGGGSGMGAVDRGDGGAVPWEPGGGGGGLSCRTSLFEAKALQRAWDSTGSLMAMEGQNAQVEDSAAGLLHAWVKRADAFQQRAALVAYLQQSTAGISVYGFVLDRFFIHTSFGALCTTTWFILGRSLGA